MIFRIDWWKMNFPSKITNFEYSFIYRIFVVSNSYCRDRVQQLNTVFIVRSYLKKLKTVKKMSQRGINYL